MFDDFVLSEIDHFNDITEYYCDQIDVCNEYLCCSKQFLSVLQMNIRSANKNFDEFLLHINELQVKPTVVVLTETHSNSNNCSFSIPSYNCISTENFINRCSGILIFVKEDILVEFAQEIMINLVNCIRVDLLMNSKKYTIVAVYRTHESCAFEFVDSIRGALQFSVGRPTIIVGDININIASDTQSQIKDEYINMLIELNFKSCINRHTRIVGGQNPTCIDHIWVNFDDVHNVKTVNYECKITDHNMCILVYTGVVRGKTSYSKEGKLVKKIVNNEQLKIKLKNENWSMVLTSISVDECARNFEEILNLNLAECTRLETTVLKSNHRVIKPWITPNLIKCIRKKQRIYRLHKKYPHDFGLKSNFAKYKNILQKTLQMSKTNYYKSRLAQMGNNKKRLWSVVKEIMGKQNKKSSMQFVRDGETRIEVGFESKRGADVFNNFFATVGENLASSIKNSNIDLIDSNNDTCENFCDFILPTEQDVSEIIKTLKSGSSPGYDGISAEFLKQYSTFLIKPLMHIVSKSLVTGLFPQIYKKTIIVPIYKNNDPELVTNYRPISLVSNISKIIEKVVKKQTLNYLENYNLLNSNQFGFRNKMGTDDAIAKLTSIIINQLDRKDKCLGVFIDLRKAFDSISHQKLLREIRKLGVGGRVLSWFGSFIDNREQRVKLNNATSEALTSCYGIPQGTVIGPLLFIMYVNSMFNLPLKCDIVAYADDTVVVAKGATWNEAFSNANTDMNIIKNYLDGSLLSLNAEKTVYMTFSLIKPGPQLDKLIIHDRMCTTHSCQLVCRELKQVESVKYLGIVIDFNMKYKNLIENIVSRLRKMIYLFLHLRDILTLNETRNIYFALVQSVLQYGIVGWGGIYPSTLRPIVVAQKLLLKIMYKKPRDFPSERLFRELKVCSLDIIYKKTAILKVIKNYKTQNLTGSRHMETLRIPRCNSAAAQHHFQYIGIKEYNKLPINIRKITSGTLLRNKIKQIFSPRLGVG